MVRIPNYLCIKPASNHSLKKDFFKTTIIYLCAFCQAILLVSFAPKKILSRSKVLRELKPTFRVVALTSIYASPFICLHLYSYDCQHLSPLIWIYLNLFAFVFLQEKLLKIYIDLSPVILAIQIHDT